jgi:predicted acetyltransferase
VTEQLVQPTVDVHASWLAGIAELQEEERSLDVHLEELADPDAFADYCRKVRAMALPETPRLPGWVPSTTLWWVDPETGAWHGWLDIRHDLTRELRDVGGHIGYVVRPSSRRQGHATRMLEASKSWAAGHGIDPALVTCDHANVASRKVIEAAGGIDAGHSQLKRRYWVPTSTT